MRCKELIRQQSKIGVFSRRRALDGPSTVPLKNKTNSDESLEQQELKEIINNEPQKITYEPPEIQSLPGVEKVFLDGEQCSNRYR